MEFSTNHLLKILNELPKGDRYLVAFSGGLDSTVLLHALAGLRERLSGGLVAVHVDHGLQPDSRLWAEQAGQFCAALEIPLIQQRLEIVPQPGESLEALARQRRYQSLAGVLLAGDLLLTAQHRDDQAETLLLQLLRGSGPAGLAAMPRIAPLGQGRLVRPLLDFPRSALEAYAHQQGLQWLEDPSNAQLQFDRNYLRHRVVPMLKARWPAADATLSRSASLCGDAQQLIDELVAEDLAAAEWCDGVLSMRHLLSLSSPRQRSLLRHWIRAQGAPLPGSRHLLRIERELLGSRKDAQPLVEWAGWQVRRYRDGIYLMKSLKPFDRATRIYWEGGDSLQLPAAMGELRCIDASQGISLDRWQASRVEVRFRQGGECCRPVADPHRRPLKQLFQQWGIPPWIRQRVPLLYLDGELAALPGLVVCQPFQNRPGEAALELVGEMPGYLRSLRQAAEQAPSSA
ncbi:tRNA lysidine(34) synthetase TilS [Candidatus Endoriftia persephone]|jgi:tRNA(Ile)-lysidine synthase|uniref:tRNA(Ile)-lysidine synthase n=3 Tax=Gammaproteobacteria TaxID=1236 RepID=G2FGD7_9GAMM|nr:tRNA lysidine(34) synthetase TilS [Candidatus Endoriftia persephone]EGV51369.1 tRNA(Ile)-lysidine synthase [endosymbiont of Riftia pachyptila (vent Ph05)]EGW54210.1 tRNA(Ile)-lysidine synthase [endosymbiont of Tevnia jerichonana (vent Tica)]USF88579.1 tRNA lysidine(34) synthetase TilS [Candidatus Endoriftia persephone]